MPVTIGVRELKNHASRVIRAVREEMAEYVVTLRGEPVAGLSGGRLGWAVQASHNPHVLEQRARRLEEMQALMGQGRAERFAYAEKLSRDAVTLREVMNLWLTWWRDLLLLVHGSTASLTHQDRNEDLGHLAKKLQPEQARQAVEAIRAAIRGLDSHANSRLTAEVLMLNLPTL